MAWLSGWNYRKKITVQYANIDSDLTWFPLYVDITADSDIGGHVSDTTDGLDIRFTKTDGTTLLKYEREDFSVAAGDATGHFWVSADGWVLANDAGTDLYIYYNDGDGTVDGEDASAVWDGDFKAVWHLKESGDGSDDEFVDSSGNANHGTGGGVKGSGDSGKTPTQVTGKVHKGQSFDGADDIIHFGNDASMKPTAAFTWTMWVKLDGTGEAGNPHILRWLGEQIFLVHDASDKMWARTKADSTTVAVNDGTVIPSSFTFYALRYTDGDLYLYRNVTEADTNSLSGDVNYGVTSGLQMNLDSEAFDGDIDEVRISDGARSVAWLKFEYYNMNEADNELDWASEESAAVTYIPKVIMIN